MKHKLSPENPFGYIPKGLAFELIKESGRRGRHLDYGTFNGEFVAALSRARIIATAVGVDVNAEMIAQSIQQMPANVSLEVIRKNAPLRFAPAEFDTISILGVIEHVQDQVALLAELARSLKPDGLVVIAVPGQHLFSFLDMGNFKFRFPRAHRAVYSAMHSPEEYRHRYVECRNGLFGDIEVEKMWHEHFSVASMQQLLSQVGLEITAIDGLGFFQRILANIAYFCGGRRGIFRWCVDWDARVFHRCELVFLAQKALDAGRLERTGEPAPVVAKGAPACGVRSNSLLA